MAERGGVDSLNIVIGANTEALKKGLDDAVKAFQGTSQSLEKQAAKAQKSMERLLKGATDPGANLKQQNRNLTNLAGAYMQMGEAGSAGFKKVTEQAIAARRQMEDVNDAIMAADLEGKAKLAARGFNEATQAVAGMQGAMHLLGMDTKSAAEVTATLQSLMAVGQGVEGIVALEGTITALIGKIQGATVAQKLFNIALSPTGLIGIATAAIIIISSLADQMSRTEKAQRAVNSVLREATGSVEKQRLQVEFYKGVINDTTKSEDERLVALNKLKEIVPSLADNEIGNANALAKTNTELNDYIHNAVLRAQIDALIAKRAENNNKIADITSGKLSDNASFADKATAAFKSFATGTSYTMQLTAESADGLGRSLSDLTTENNKLDEQLKSLEGQYIKTEVAQSKYQAQSQKKTPNNPAAPKIKVPIKVEPEVEKVEKLNDEARRKIHREVNRLNNGKDAPLASVPINIDFGTLNFKENLRAKIHEAFDYARVGVSERSFQIASDIGNALDSGIKQMAINMAGALGDLAMNIVAGAEDPLAKFGDALLSTLAGFMQTLGQAMMAAGLASQKFQALLFTQPAGAIIAGAALIVAAGAVKGIMQKGIEGRKSKGSTSSNNQPAGIRPFADGGIISGPTLGLMGEYPGARSNPEVVAPLNKLKDMIGGGGNLTTRVSGQDLLIMLDRAETNRGRVR
jgi:hypothetical protein